MKFNVKIFPKSLEHIFYLYIDKIFYMYPKSSVGNAPATDLKHRGSTLAVGVLIKKNFFKEFYFKKQQYLRMTLM